MRELAYTGRRFAATEARGYGFLNAVEADHAAALAAGEAMALTIAARSPLAMTGIKHVLNHGRDHSIEDGLDYVALWNAAMLQGGDVPAAIGAQMAKRERCSTISRHRALAGAGPATHHPLAVCAASRHRDGT